MSVKNNILHILESNRGKTLSGQELANMLNVSRTAVWKAINSLRECVRYFGFLKEAVSGTLLKTKLLFYRVHGSNWNFC